MMDDLYIPIATKDTWELSFKPPEIRRRRLSGKDGLDGFVSVLKTNERVRRNSETMNGRLNRLVIGARASSKGKNLSSFSITRDDVKDLWNLQSGLCYYSKIPMDFKTKSHLLVSLDRKDPDKGYYKENCVLAAWAVNRAKSTMTVSQLKMICDAVAKNCPAP